MCKTGLHLVRKQVISGGRSSKSLSGSSKSRGGPSKSQVRAGWSRAGSLFVLLFVIPLSCQGGARADDGTKVKRKHNLRHRHRD